MGFGSTIHEHNFVYHAGPDRRLCNHMSDHGGGNNDQAHLDPFQHSGLHWQIRQQPMKVETELAAAHLSPHFLPPASPDLLYSQNKPTRIVRLSPPYSRHPTTSTLGADPFDATHFTCRTGPLVPPAVPVPKRRRIDLNCTRLASLVSIEDFVVADDAPGHSIVTDPKAPGTIIDDFGPAFAIVEYFATPNTTAAFVSGVFSAVQLVVVARYLIHHTWRNPLFRVGGRQCPSTRALAARRRGHGPCGPATTEDVC